MKTKFVCIIALLAMVFGAVAVSEAAIQRVPARYNLINFYGGYASPWGEYSDVGLFLFVDQNDRPVWLDADQVFNSSYYIGMDYGSIVNRYFQVLIGFRYTNNNVQDYIHQDYVNGVGVDFTYRTYDVNFDFNFYPIDLAENVFSPYAGAGLQAGFVVFSPKGYDSDSKAKVAGSLNFGADLKVFEGPNQRSFVTLASANSYNFYATDNRPKYLNIGGALRYWFR